VNPLLIAKLVGGGLIVAIVVGGAFMLRHELIEKGKNIVYAQDNAARLKAQDEQIAGDQLRIEDLQEANRRRVLEGSTIKETIRVVQGPCTKDGADDARLKQFHDWLRTRPPYDSRSTDDRRPAKTAVPPPGR
jgi:hypothetical protein